LTGEFGPPPPDGSGRAAAPAADRPGTPEGPAAAALVRPERRYDAGQPVVRAAEHPSDTTLREAAAASEAHQVPRGSSKLKVAAAVGVAALGGFVIWAATRSSPQPIVSVSVPVVAPEARPIVPSVKAPAPPVAPAPLPSAAVPYEIRSVPTDAEIALDDRPPTRGLLELVLPLAGATHRIRVSAPGFVARVVEFGSEEQPPTEVRLDRAPPHVAKKVDSKVDSKVDKKVQPKVETKAASRDPSEAAPATPPRVAKLPKPHPEPAAPTLAPPVAPPRRGPNNALILK